MTIRRHTYFDSSLFSVWTHTHKSIQKLKDSSQRISFCCSFHTEIPHLDAQGKLIKDFGGVAPARNNFSHIILWPDGVHGDFIKLKYKWGYNSV